MEQTFLLAIFFFLLIYSFPHLLHGKNVDFCAFLPPPLE